MSGEDGFAAAAHPAGVEHNAALLERALFEVKRVLVGQDAMVERMLARSLATLGIALAHLTAAALRLRAANRRLLLLGALSLQVLG